MKRKNKPTKDPFIKYYIVWPIENLAETLADTVKGSLEKTDRCLVV